MHKELKAIKRELERQGFNTWVTKDQHLAVYKDGQWVTSFAGTPSDFRSWKNSMSKCRRAGFQWPP